MKRNMVIVALSMLGLGVFMFWPILTHYEKDVELRRNECSRKGGVLVMANLDDYVCIKTVVIE